MAVMAGRALLVPPRSSRSPISSCTLLSHSPSRGRCRRSAGSPAPSLALWGCCSAATRSHLVAATQIRALGSTTARTAATCARARQGVGAAAGGVGNAQQQLQHSSATTPTPTTLPHPNYSAPTARTALAADAAARARPCLQAAGGAERAVAGGRVAAASGGVVSLTTLRGAPHHHHPTPSPHSPAPAAPAIRTRASKGQHVLGFACAPPPPPPSMSGG